MKRHPISVQLFLAAISIFLLLGCIDTGQQNQEKEETRERTITNKFPAQNYRYIICTDMTHDDDNSMVRLLHYANEIDIEAIIVTEQGPETVRIENWPTKMWNRMQEILNRYEKVEENLRLHHPDYPTADYFRSITKKGKGSAQRMSGSMDKGQERFWDYVGEDRDSDGSDFLQQVFERDDERPMYIGFWGGTITFAQAMWRYTQSHTKEEVKALLGKMIFHSISFQDVTFDYFINLDSVESRYEFYGDFEGERLLPERHYYDTENFWKYIGVIDEKDVHATSGILGALYDGGGEGDTPAFLNLISMNLGLNNIDYPEYGGWGDQFSPSHLPKAWKAIEGGNELMRWLPDATNNFFARAQWEKRSFDEANHVPQATLNGDDSKDFIQIESNPGEKVSFSAKGSNDPDGDELIYKWWQHKIADSYEGSVLLSDTTGIETSFTVPNDLGDHEIHIILEVVDNGEPALKSYRRVIINKAN